MQAPDRPGVETAGSPRGTLDSIFLGPEGLRAGWASFLFLLLLFLLSLAVSATVKHLLHLAPPVKGAPVGVRALFLGELASVALVFLATFAMARIEHRRTGSFGLRDPAFLPRLAGGLLAGFAAISALVGWLWARHLLVLGGPTLSSSQAVVSGLQWAVAFLLVGFFEEMLLRGYLLFTLARGIGFPWAALLLSLAFGLVHGSNKGETPVGLFSAGAVSLLFCLSIWYTRSLWWAIGFHAAWDWGQSFFWGTSDSGMMIKGHLLDERPAGAALLSGGATGPEGSLYVFPLLLLCTLLVVLWWRPKRLLRATEA